MKISRPCSASLPGKRTSNSPRLLAACMALFAGASGLSAQAASPVSKALVRSARDALAMGYLDAASDYAAAALDASPADADANLLSALLDIRAGTPPWLTKPKLEVAIASGGFSVYSGAEARLLYAGLLVRTHNPADALRFLNGLPRDAEVLYLESVAFRQRGDQAAAARAIAESLRRFPRDPRAILAWLRAAERPSPSPADRALVDAAFKALPALKETDPLILLALAPYAASVDASRLLVREYRANGGEHAQATALALRYGLIDEDRAVAEAFSGAVVPDEASLKAIAEAISSPEGRRLFADAFSAYTGTIVADTDADGLADGLSRYEGGTLAAWSLDADQDGLPEMEAAFAESAPVDLLARSGGTTIRLRYGPWPYLSSATVSDPKEAVAFGFAPGAVPLPLIRLYRPAGMDSGPYLAARTDRDLPGTRSLASLAIRAETRKAGDMASFELYEGETKRSWWRDAFGASGEAWYRRGVPELERVDLDGDGRQETRRAWILGADGAPAMDRMEADLDGDGVFEYRKRFLAPLLETWDLDADGLPDLGYETMEDGTRIYSFSGRRDGRLDTRAFMAGGALKRVERDGEPLDMVPDSGGLVTWLGAKPFDFGSAKPTPGMGARAGVRYAVIELAGRLFAEALE